MASSSSSAPQWRYNVFLSFRGPDTRKSITSDLYDQLQNKRGIKTFMDDQDLPVGGEISPTLLYAIEESRFAIVVLSKEYASSTWCLEELTKICQSMKDGNRILPVFYDAKPSDVRNQKGSFEEAFNKHGNTGQHKKVQQWKDALETVANISGWERKNFKSDRELVETIVEDVCTRVGSVEIKTGDFEIFAATRRAMDDVMKALEDDRVTAIGVYGMGGVGKTTMVEHIGAQARKKGMFDHVIMAKVSQSPDRRNIQGTYADLMRIKLVGETENGRASELNEQFLKKNKVLIIVDDIWAGIDLSSIGIPNPEELQRCKSKVLLTTRVTRICCKMGCQEEIFLDTLSTNDSWTLFVRNAGMSFESKFEKVARRVAGECGGLPIALIAVAKALQDKNLVEWQKAAQRLEKSQTTNPDDMREAFKCIKLSYDYLKDEDYKSCFLLCCLFPEDYDIPLEDLFRYAFGKGLFRDVDTIEEARGTTVSVAKHLKDCSLLLDSKEKECVRMHDVIRDTAIEIAKSKGYFVKARCGLKDWQAQVEQERDYSVVSLMKNDICKLPEQLVCPKLQLLLLPGNYNLNEIPKTFFQSLNELSVLDLSDCSFSLLPQSFSLLTNLQALCLNCCKNVTSTSILGNLKKLEILSMREYPCKKLSAKIGQLTNLRMLDISGGRGIVTIPSKVISKLHRLEELYMLDCGFKHWGSSFEARTTGIASCFPNWGGEETNIGLDELVGLPNLTILQVDIANAVCIPEKVDVKPNWVDFVIRIGVYSIDTLQFGTFDSRTNHNSKCLHLGGTTIATLPDWFVNTVTEKTEVLQYSYCGGLSNILMEFDHGRLNELKCLYMNGKGHVSDNLVVLMNSRARVKTEPVFMNLEELHLDGLFSLEVLCVGELPLGSLSNLHVLDVKFCRKLENVSKFLQRLPNLETLHLHWNDVIMYVFETQRKQSKLREMHLCGLKALKSICKDPIQHPMFQTLKILVIYQCKSLRSVFASDVSKCLCQLEDLFVENCLSLECVIEARKEAAMHKKIILPKLKSLVLSDLPKLKSLVLNDLPKLKIIPRRKCSASAIAVDLECPSLEHLHVQKCPLYSFSAPQFQSENQVQLNDEPNYKRLWALLCLSEKITNLLP